MSKDLDPEEASKRSKNLKKITKYLIRQTYSGQENNNEETLDSLKEMSFLDFIYQAGMFHEEKPLSQYSPEETKSAKL